MFPADNAWNTDVSAAPVHANSANYIANILANGGDFLHADFGGGGAYGIPYVTVGADQPDVATEFIEWPEDSDPGPYPIPLNAPIEGGSDRHVLAVDRDDCVLYELFNATPMSNRWQASNGRALGPALERAATRSAGRRRTRPACRSSRVSSATTRCRRATSTTRCGSP